MNYEAQRMQQIPFSGIRVIFERASALQAQGHSIIPLYIGRPDFDTPEHIKQAAKDALDAGLTAYTSNYGLIELRQAIARKLARDNAIQADPHKEIIVTVGTNEAISMTMLGLLNPGDEIIIPDPMWPHYLYCAALAGARVVSLPLLESNQFQPDPDALEKLITTRTRMIVLNSPHNPTGMVIQDDILRAIIHIIEKHGLLLLSDEIYEHILYDDAQHISPGAFESIREQTITVNGFAKAYSMTGWRLGYVVANPSIISSLIRVHQYTTSSATSFAQAGGIAALDGPQECVKEMVAQFAQRRVVLMRGLSQIPGISCVKPSGAFYAFPNISRLSSNSMQAASDLLEQTGVALVPGSTFGNHGEGYLRISYACSIEDIQQGMQRMQDHWSR